MTERIWEVGEFTLTGSGTVTGPAEYMEERGSARLREIEAGRDVVFNFGASGEAGSSPDAQTAILVSLQTDYAGWKGARSVAAALGRS